jgi:putative peptidoglycan lipid II flippase
VLVKTLSPAFFAREDTWTPLLATLKGFVFAIALALLLGHFLGPSGIAIGLTFGAWSTASSLIRQGATSFGLSLDAGARRRLPRIVAAALVMGGLLWLGSGVAANAHGLAQAVLLLALIAGAIVTYGLLLLAFRVITPDEVVNAFSRKGHRDLHI